MTDIIYCRLCAEIKSFQDVFIIDKGASSTTFNLKILQCFQIEINLDDNLPKTICLNCYDQTNSMYEFYQKTHKSQEILQTIFNNEIKQIKEEFKETSSCTNLNETFTNEPIKNEIKESDNENEYNYANFDNIKNDENWTNSNNSEGEADTVLPKQKKNKTKKGKKVIKKSTKNLKTRLEAAVWKDFVWKCSICSKEFQSVNELREHFKSEHDSNSKPMEYVCTECSKTYKKYPLFRRHVQKHRDRFKYRCEICNKFFHLNCRYQMHMKYAHEQTEREKYVCPICGKRFKWPSSLDKHKRYVHLPDEKKYQYECEICHKKVSTASNLITHKKVHNDVRDHTCEHCGVAFRQQGNLKQHILYKHTDLKADCPCTMCPKVFKTTYGLKKHQKIHFDGELYKCEECQKEFRHKRALKRHATIHTGILPYECEYCKKCFRGKFDLEVHLRQHTGERPYSCIECNHHFANNSNFIKHLKGRHGLKNFSIANQRQYPFIN